MGKIVLEMDDFLPLREVVFQSLRTAILEGTLEPGERLMEIHLAQELGVSRTPVREAIRKLELEGLVVTYPRRGAVVANITRKDLEDVLEVRQALEELVMQKAAVSITDQQIRALHRAEEKFIEYLEHGDVTKSATADAEFHEIISNATGNARLVALLSNLRGQMYRYRMENLKDTRSHSELIEHHKRIIAAMEQHDPEAAAKTITEHIELQRQSILDSLRMLEDKKS